MKKILLMYICCLVAGISNSQTDERKWNIGVHGGLVEYAGDKGDGYFRTKQASYGFASISVSRYLSRHFDASLNFTRGDLGHVDHTVASTATTPNSFLVRVNTTNLMLRFNFTGPQAVVRPYIFVGAGAIWYEAVYNIHHERFEFSVPTFGGGFNFRMGPVVSLQLQEMILYTSTDNIDHENSGGTNDFHLYHTAGLTFNLGKQKDSDNDGVPDKKDQCPNTPAGVAVDKVGCPLDRDHDGVADYMDACPDVAGLPALKGCPDKDMDGITDAEDRCPDVAGTVALKGCPDSDQDGVVDIDDKCPGTPAGYKVDATGCTYDNDKDGIVNEEDRCPDLAGILAFKGCPDTDGDGVSDLDDRCPTIKGNIDNKGCPEIPKEDIQRITLIAGKIYFETNSDKLKLISYANLDDLVQILKRHEAVNLTIEGHTDNVGDDAYNMTLSQKRTESVKDYLVSKGISASRLTAIGYGETKPIADNNKADGRARNRRVELKTSY
jgi:OOP family OmpA-OmpF porin